MTNKLSSPAWRWSRRPFFADNGFTILEVLAALTLTGLIMLAIFSTLQNTYTIWWRSHTEGDPERISRLLTRRLEDLLTSAYLYPYHDQKIPLLSGDHKGFSLPVHGPGGLLRAGFFLREDSLVYWCEDLRNPEKETFEEILVTGVQEIEFAYLDGKTGLWHSFWQENYYPRLVSLRKIHLRRGEEIRILPPVTIPLWVGTVYD